MRDSGQLLAVVHTGMVKAGLDVNAIYTRLGYDADRLDLRALRTRHQAQVLFWHTVETVSGDPDVGLHLCPHLPVFRGDVLEYLVFSSPTFGEGCRRALKYLRLVSDAIAMRLVQDARGSRLAVVGSQLDAPQLRHTEICVVYELIKFGLAVTENTFKPLSVRLRCEPRSPVAEYRKAFGCPVEFGGEESEIWFDPKVLAYRSPHWDPDLLQLHEELAEKRLSTLKRADLIDQIRRIFSQRLELEALELEDVAKELGIAPRRLRFELTRAGTSYSDLLANFRYALARKLLATTTEPIENIVYLTGFSEPSTFYRAFKRWSGVTPVQFREAQRAVKSGPI